MADESGALAQLTATVERLESTREAREAFEYLHARLLRISEHVERGGGAEPALLGPTVRAFCDLVARQSARRLVLQRLAARRRVDVELRELHGAVDALEAELGVEERTGEWQAQVEASADEQLARFSLALKNPRVLRQEANGDGVEEAVMTLCFEAQYRREELSSGALELVEHVLRWARKALGPDAAPDTVPVWYIPSDEVNFAASGFDIGSFGSVHRGTWRGGERVVVKKLLTDDAAARASFLSEATVWWDLHHEHVVRLLGACHVSRPPLFVCEEATRGNFVSYLDPEGDTRGELWRLFYEAALGLQYLHKQLVVHGDLKGNNLLVSADGHAKICDFGFAFIRSESAVLTTKPQADSSRWKAPECLLGDGESAPTPDKNPRFASDVYSLGLCLVEAFADEPPYGWLDDDSIIDKALNGELPERPPLMIDDRAWDLVTRMCAREWEDRPTIEQVVEQMKVFADEVAQDDKLAATAPSDRP